MANKSEKGRHTGLKDQMVLGMPVDDLIAGAKLWWESRGAPMMKRRAYAADFKTQQDALNATNPAHPQYIGGQSGILLGYTWSMLTAAEHYSIVKLYTLVLKQSIEE